LISSNGVLYGTESAFLDSVIFTFNTQGYNVLYNFSAPNNSGHNKDGSGPTSLILSGNMLFGTAEFGGKAGNDNEGDGTLFSLNINLSEERTNEGFTNLHTCSQATGVSPDGGMVLVSNLLCGTTLGGGIGDNGTVFEINTNGSGFLVVHDFSAIKINDSTNLDGAVPEGNLVASNNLVYGITSIGGINGGGTVFALAAPIPINLTTSGQGTVSGIQNGEILNSAHLVTAKPMPGFIFAGWTGATNSFENPLKFEPGFSNTLTANFIPNWFPPFATVYNGLFYTNPVTENTAGMLSHLTLHNDGLYSANVLISGASHSVTGGFNALGNATNLVNRPAKEGGPVLVAINLETNPVQIVGSVFGTNGSAWTAPLLATPLSATNPSSQYTMLIPPATNGAPATSPGGYGYALLTNHEGTVRISGVLADGVAFSQNVTSDGNGYVPLYASLYGNQGMLFGWINLWSNSTATNVGLTWFHPTLPSNNRYPNAFTNTLSTNQLLFSGWTNPPAGTPSIAVTNGALTFAPSPFDTNALLVLTNLTVSTGSSADYDSIVGSDSLTGSINRRTGAFKVIFEPSDGANKLTDYGAALQDTNMAGGYVLTATNSESITLGP
jgi:hypothetical protein